MSQEEIFDVVDDRDVVIEQRPRSVVHKLKLKHRAVHVLIFNRAGRLFLQKRSPLKDCFPGTWDSSSSGHLDQGESYDACAIRESREELGLALSEVPERLFKVDACEQTGWEFVWVYRCQSEGPFVLLESEITEGRFFELPEIEKWGRERAIDFAPAFLYIWNEMKMRGQIHV